jgi:hypothetical protein
MEWFREMRSHYELMGPARFSVFFGGLTATIVAFGSLGWWLSEVIGWPEAYGFRCGGRGCYFLYLIESPKLLRSGGAYEISLFVWFWFIPAGTSASIAWVLFKRFLTRRRDRIRPMDYN